MYAVFARQSKVPKLLFSSAEADCWSVMGIRTLLGLLWNWCLLIHLHFRDQLVHAEFCSPKHPEGLHHLTTQVTCSHRFCGSRAHYGGSLDQAATVIGWCCHWTTGTTVTMDCDPCKLQDPSPLVDKSSTWRSCNWDLNTTGLGLSQGPKRKQGGTDQQISESHRIPPRSDVSSSHWRGCTLGNRATNWGLPKRSICMEVLWKHSSREQLTPLNCLLPLTLKYQILDVP